MDHGPAKRRLPPFPTYPAHFQFPSPQSSRAFFLPLPIPPHENERGLYGGEGSLILRRSRSLVRDTCDLLRISKGSLKEEGFVWESDTQ